jgi:glycosyltransferase involved in cell wall biosynthesis
MRALHLIQRYPPAVGGSETWCQEVCRYLASVGDDVKVLTLDVVEEEEYWRVPPMQQRRIQLGRVDWDDGVLVRRFKRSLPVHTLHHLLLGFIFDRLLRIYFYGPHSIEMYGRLFAEVKAAEVVHLHTIPYPHNLIGYLVARLFKKRVIITPHFHPAHPHYERWCNYWLLKRCDAVITVSTYERDYLVSKGVDGEKIVVTGNGVHLEDYRFKPRPSFQEELSRKYHLPEKSKIILFIGRKLEYKGIEILVEAFRQLSADHHAALLLVGPASDWFEGFYGKLTPRERERIIDLGVVSHDEKVNLLYLADVLVLPSQFEAFGIVFLEAWACGTPVIGSARGAMPSVIGDGGLTFEYGNSVDLTAKIDMLLKNERGAREMALNGQRRLSDQYTWEKIGMVVRNTYLPARKSPMRILICSALFPPHVLGGAELVAYKQAKALRALGHEVRIFSGRLSSAIMRPYRVTSTKKEFHTTWVSLSPRHISGDSWNFYNQQIRRAFANVLEEFAPDVVHFHNLSGLSIKMIDECQTRGIPAVMTLHDYWGICFKNTMIKNDGSICMQSGFDCLGCKETLWSDRSIPSPVRNSHILLSLDKVDRFIAPSRYLAERYATNGLPLDKIVVLHNGIDLDLFPSTRMRHDKLILGFIGYLGKHKGIDFLLRALTLVHDLEKIRLLIVGDGEEARYLKSLCRELNLDRYVTFHGRVDNRHIPTIYEKIDVLVVPSIWPENSPVTISEAMASGIPVIAFNLGGISEMVEEGVTGFLVSPKDIHTLAERIERFLIHPDLRHEMGKKAVTKIQQYDLRTQVDRILMIYEEICQQRKTKQAMQWEVVLYDSDQAWSLPIREMFRQLAEVEKRLERRLLICRMDLSDADTVRLARVLIIPWAGRDSLPRALQALQRQIPLLVNAGAQELKELCLASNAGLFYTNPEELRECLGLLLSNESLRVAMGINGRKFVESYQMNTVQG